MIAELERENIAMILHETLRVVFQTLEGDKTAKISPWKELAFDKKHALKYAVLLIQSRPGVTAEEIYQASGGLIEFDNITIMDKLRVEICNTLVNAYINQEVDSQACPYCGNEKG